MTESGTPQLNRRGFLQTGAAASALSLATVAPGLALGAPEGEKKETLLPKRPLGKTGVDVCILSQGTWRSPGAVDRLLRIGYAGGVRYVDTAKSYGSEPDVAKWLELDARSRQDTQGNLPRHQGPPQHAERPDQSARQAAARPCRPITSTCSSCTGSAATAHLDWPKSKEFKETIETIKKSGKAKFVGFSCHDALKVAVSAERPPKGGSLMRSWSPTPPWLDKDKQLEPRARRLPQGGHRPDLDEADRRQPARRS